MISERAGRLCWTLHYFDPASIGYSDTVRTSGPELASASNVLARSSHGSSQLAASSC